MRYRTLTLILLILLASGLTSVKGAEAEPRVGVNRVVAVTEWGSLTVVDTIIINNRSPSPLESFRVGFPFAYAERLRSFGAVSREGEPLQVQAQPDQASRIIWLNVKFREPLKSGANETFTVLTAFTDIVSFKVDKFNYTFTAFPVLPVAAIYNNVTIILPPDAKTGAFATPQQPEEEEEVPPTIRVVRVGGRPAVNYLVAAPSNRAFRFTFNFTSLDQKILDVKWAERKITLDEQGTVEVWDTYNLQNRARATKAIPLKLPKGATGVSVHDPAGPISYSVLEKGPQAYTNVSIIPRFKDLKQNQSFTFTAKYRLPNSEYVKTREWWGRHSLKFDLQPNQLAVINRLNVTIVTPPGMRVENITRVPERVIGSGLEKAYQFHYDSVTPIDDLSFEMKYLYASSWASLKPLAWIAALEIALAAFIVVVRRRPRSVVSVAVPVEGIRRFVELYDEKSSLRLELDRMEQELARGALSKHDFKRRRKAIEARFSELNRDLGSVKNKLRGVQARYDEMISRLDKAEAELQAAKVSESQIRGQYRSGLLTKEAYETVVNDLRRRADKAKETIDSVTITLREEAH